MEQTGNTPAPSAPVTFTRGAALSAPISASRSSKYDGLLEDILTTMIDAPFGEWQPWTADSLKAAERAVVPVRNMGKVEGQGEYHFNARAQQDPSSEAGILFVRKIQGPAPTRTKKTSTDDAAN